MTLFSRRNKTSREYHHIQILRFRQSWKSHIATSTERRRLPHQQDQRGAANHGDGRGEFALVASAVGPCTAAGVLAQTQLLDAPLCHLQAGKIKEQTNKTTNKQTRLSITETSSPRTSLQTTILNKRGCVHIRGKLVRRAAGLRLTLGISDSGTPLRRAYRYRCSLPVRSSSMASN